MDLTGLPIEEAYDRIKETVSDVEEQIEMVKGYKLSM
jgi:hypothetical protein